MHILNRKKFMNSSLNDGTAIKTVISEIPCYCVFGAFFNALESNYAPSYIDWHDNVNFRAYNTEFISYAPNLEYTDDPVFNILKQGEATLLAKNAALYRGGSCQQNKDPIWEESFKLQLLHDLQDVGVKVIDPPGDPLVNPCRELAFA